LGSSVSKSSQEVSPVSNKADAIYNRCIFFMIAMYLKN
jgi:hypothetical protein